MGVVPKMLCVVVVTLANTEAAVAVELFVVTVPPNTDDCVVLLNIEDFVVFNIEASLLVGLSKVVVVVGLSVV